jgi:hypothetical protein
MKLVWFLIIAASHGFQSPYIKKRLASNTYSNFIDDDTIKGDRRSFIATSWAVIPFLVPQVSFAKVMPIKKYILLFPQSFNSHLIESNGNTF